MATAQLDKGTAAKLENVQQTMELLGRQMMQQQTFVEERIRTEGMSGVKTLRQHREGTRPYFSDHHISGTALAAHDHSNYDRTIGQGEFVAVMNGVDFRTRHNDFKFKMPSTTSKKFDSAELIQFPEVPPEVTNKTTLDEQIDEMRLWFKAFKDQDHSVRDYRKYFKPNLCYLEGSWTLDKDLVEPFESDRHQLDASSWFDLQEKIRWTAYAGSKSNLENFAFLPTMMYNITDGIPQYAQWNYRIMCHPVSRDVPTSYFKVQDDFSTRMSRKFRWDQVEKDRAARFKINEFGTDRSTQYTFLDSIMAEIPGKDNYGANITDSAFGVNTYDISEEGNVTLNAGYYHRWYKVAQPGVLGMQVNQRGFRDENLWVALTTQPNIMPLSIKKCEGDDCVWETRRVTYAFPLEIVYSSPLQGWNPYDLVFHKNFGFPSRDGRNGQPTPEKAYNGTSGSRYFITPSEFFTGKLQGKDSADTGRKGAGVLDRNGTVRQCMASGFRMLTPNIPGVGYVRLRYPIFPVHSEGSTVGIEIDALKRAVMQMSTYSYLYEEIPLGEPLPVDEDVTFLVQDSARNPPGLHGHSFTITADEFKALKNGKKLDVTTSYNLNHNHQLTIMFRKQTKKFYINKCDGPTAKCWDGHAPLLQRVRT
ncbi:hypothetical protein PoB_006907700 [Plakobranchus ocellatus]|uniref:Capsid protein n=1 Tax=Plakobranchus ocellatus TaxID=259542 RepID=A0AAV4DEA4_9GAST|nr:hypothetical protein PoB_006907700 [Plakobranchus ocellatus]